MIRAPRVLLIDHENQNRGVVTTSEALGLATEVGLDLVQVSPPSKDRPPTCKIMNYGKFKYDQTKNQKLAAKKQRESAIKVKEIKFRPTTDMNDLKTKAKKALEFIEEGNKVKITIMFKNSEISNYGRQAFAKDSAFDMLNEFLTLVPNLQLSCNPTMEGKYLVAMAERRTEKAEAV